MNLQVDEQVFRWLLSLELLKSADGKKLKNSKFELSQLLTSAIETGHFVIKLLQILIRKCPTPTKANLPVAISANNFKQVASPSSRYYNWNLIAETLKVLAFSLDKETVNLIVMGDLPMINDFLKELCEFSKNFLKLPLGTINNSLSLESGLSISRVMDNSKVIKSLQPETKESIELLGLQIDKPLAETESIMEFFVLDLAKSLNIKPNQVFFFFKYSSLFLS